MLLVWSIMSLSIVAILLIIIGVIAGVYVRVSKKQLDVMKQLLKENLSEDKKVSPNVEKKLDDLLITLQRLVDADISVPRVSEYQDQPSTRLESLSFKIKEHSSESAIEQSELAKSEDTEGQLDSIIEQFELAASEYAEHQSETVSESESISEGTVATETISNEPLIVPESVSGEQLSLFDINDYNDYPQSSVVDATTQAKLDTMTDEEFEGLTK